MRLRPENLFKLIIYRHAAELRHAVKNQLNRWTLVVAELIPLQDLPHYRFNPQLFPQLPRQGLFRLLARFNFATGKFPLAAMPVVALTLANQDSSAVGNDTGHNGNCFRHDQLAYTEIQRIGENEKTVYSPQLLDHFANPRNAGEIAAPTLRVACENPVCGDQLRLTLRCEASKLVEVKFLARGCTASIACASALTELLTGKQRHELSVLRAKEIEAAVGGLIPESKHAAVLCADAVKAVEAAWKQLG